jgi:hypothetical protein
MPLKVILCHEAQEAAEAAEAHEAAMLSEDIEEEVA